MGDYILLVDSQEGVKAELNQVIASSSVRIMITTDVASAKRKMFQAVPAIIISAVVVENQDDAGFRFCGDLRQHSEFARIPVILIGEEINEQSLQLAKEAGAKAYYSRQVKANDLYKVICAVAPQVGEQLKFSPNTDETTEVEPAAAKNSEYLRILLAKILRNVNSSGILDFCTEKQVPALLMDMTRLVCENEKQSLDAANSEPFKNEDFSLKPFIQ
ncbi:MAG: response regulator [Deltaproteobacteria bacterium]|nr:response regulator [Deltaproteobacteria bacterium]